MFLIILNFLQTTVCFSVSSTIAFITFSALLKGTLPSDSNRIVHARTWSHDLLTSAFSNDSNHIVVSRIQRRRAEALQIS